jgi:hypothetical protein
MRRYRPFSHTNLLHDEPLPRCGSLLLLFLEPKELCPASDDEAPRPTAVDTAADPASED